MMNDDDPRKGWGNVMGAGVLLMFLGASMWRVSPIAVGLIVVIGLCMTVVGAARL